MQFTKAVEAKQVAQQDAERARFVVLKADQVLPSACSYACPDFLVHRAFAIFPSRQAYYRIFLLRSFSQPACAEGHSLLRSCKSQTRQIVLSCALWAFLNTKP